MERLERIEKPDRVDKREKAEKAVGATHADQLGRAGGALEPEALWTRSFVLLTASAFLLFLNLHMLLSSFSPYVKSELAASDLEVSLVTSVFAVSAIGARFLTAALLKRLQPGVLLIAGLVIAAVSTSLNSLPGSVGALLLVRAGYGVGFGIASTILPTLASRIIPLSRMGEGIGYFGLSSSLAMSIGPMIGLNVMGRLGFGVLTVAGAATIVFMLPLLLGTGAIRLRSARREKKIRETTVSAVSIRKVDNPAITPPSPAAASFNRNLIYPALLNMLLAVTYSGLLGFIALYGEFVHLEQVGMFFLFNSVAIVIIRPISGRIFDTKGHGAVLIPASLAVVASLLLLSVTETLPMLIVSALLYGLGFGSIQPSLQAWMLRTSMPEQYGQANSMFYNSLDMGVAAGVMILGGIASRTDYAVMYRYSAGFMAAFLLLYVTVQWCSSLLRSKVPIPDSNME